MIPSDRETISWVKQGEIPVAKELYFKIPKYEEDSRTQELMPPPLGQEAVAIKVGVPRMKTNLDEGEATPGKGTTPKVKGKNQQQR